MFGRSDSADRRRAWWRGQRDAIRSMTQMLTRLGFGKPAEPPFEPIERHDEPPSTLPSPSELHEQQHVNPAPDLESGHPKR